MKCKDCPYCWKDETDRFARCHFEERSPGDQAPCEYEDDYEENDCYGGDYEEEYWKQIQEFV